MKWSQSVQNTTEKSHILPFALLHNHSCYIVSLLFTLVQLIYQCKYVETTPSMPLFICCSPVLHGIVWHPQCAYANSRKTSKLDSVHNIQNDVNITRAGDRQYGRHSGHVPPCSLFANSKTPARIKFVYNIFKHILYVANASGWQ